MDFDPRIRMVVRNLDPTGAVVNRNLDPIGGVMSRNLDLTAGVATLIDGRVSMVPQLYPVPNQPASRLIVRNRFKMMSCGYHLGGQLVPARPTKDQAHNVRQRRPTPCPPEVQQALQFHHHRRLERVGQPSTRRAADSTRPRHFRATPPK
jgi:hypothetical protein